MFIDDFFHSPRSRIEAYSQMQLHLYRHDVRLQDYFLPLQMDTLSSDRIRPGEQRATNRLRTWAIRCAERVSELRPRRRIKTDVLFCPVPYFERKTENQFVARTLLGLAQTDAKILCLLPTGAACRPELDDQLAAVGRAAQVTFLDPFTFSSPIDARLFEVGAKLRAESALDQTVQILEPHGLVPSTEVQPLFEHTARFVEAWERLAPWVEFEAVVARCHWHALCSPVCRTGRQRGRPVITFQEGVIAHTLDVPVTASSYVAFGQTSASFLARLNGWFFQAAGLPEPTVEYLNGGCLFNPLTVLPDQFDRQTLLMVDVPGGPSDDFYGIESQCTALLQLAERLLAADLPLRRLIIRPHPYWSNLDFEDCKRLVGEHSTRCELSHPAWSLEDDLRRSSAVVGIYSTVLPVASACGLPTFFLETENGYTTGDLGCFRPHQTLLPDAAFCKIGKILTDGQAYAEARNQALRSAREYYADGKNLELSASFFERFLRAEPVTNRQQHGLK